MKFKHIFLLTAFVSVMVTFAACKDDEEVVDLNDPVLTISKPSEGAVIQGAIQIVLNATDESLHEMEVKVTKDADGSVVFEDQPVVHDETDYDYDQTFTPSGLSGDTPMTLEVEVHDHSENHVHKTVKFTAKP